MRVLDDFYCPSCRTVHEQWHQAGTKIATCEVSGAFMPRMLAAPNVHLESISGDFPSATARWAKDHERRAKMALRETT